MATPAPVVFISHSHSNEHEAVVLNDFVRSLGGRTILDQEQFKAGEVLPQRIEREIRGANHFLLLWSTASAGSAWVRKEWRKALELAKHVVPYRLDEAPLPEELADLIYIDRSDWEHGSPELRRALGFGPPDASVPFPGRWLVRCAVPGIVVGYYELELRANGNISGLLRFDPSGVFGQLVTGEFAFLLDLKIEATGTWSYAPAAGVLTLEIRGQLPGFPSSSETVRVFTTGREQGFLQGTDVAGRQWMMQRIDAGSRQA